jgi:hypothetical protein
MNTKPLIPSLLFFVAIFVVNYFIPKSAPHLKCYAFDEKEEFTKLANQLKNMLTEKGGYNHLGFTYDSTNGRIWSATFSKDIKSNHWESYINRNERWEKEKDFIFEFNPSDYLITLPEFNLLKLPKMIEQSKNKIIDLGVRDVVIEMLHISMNKERGKANKLDDAQIWIIVNPKYGGTDFNFYYDMTGNLISLDYHKPIKINEKPK